MKSVKIQDVEPGMVTAQDILTPSGHLLLPAGTKLTTRYIRMLHARNIPHLAIESDDQGPLAVDTPSEQSDERVGLLMNRFQRNDLDHPFIRELARACTSRLMTRA